MNTILLFTPVDDFTISLSMIIKSTRTTCNIMFALEAENV